MIRALIVGAAISIGLDIIVAAMLYKGCPLTDFWIERDPMHHF